MTNTVSLTKEVLNGIKENADEKLFIIFGSIFDKNAVSLIPLCDRFQKWNGICHECKSDACFEEGKILLCRNCKNAK